MEIFLTVVLIIAIACILVQRQYLGELKRVNSNLYKENVAMVEEIYNSKKKSNNVY